MTNTEVVTVCVRRIPVDLDDVRRVMKVLPIKDESGNFMGTTKGMEGELPTTEFLVKMRAGPWATVVYPSTPEIVNVHVAEAMTRKLLPFQERHADDWSSRNIAVHAAHPLAIGNRPVDFLVAFADFEAMANGAWRPPVVPSSGRTVEQMDEFDRLVELANMLKPQAPRL